MNIPALDKEFTCHPTVCPVGKDYHIMLPVKSPLLLWVQIGEETYYDESNGILRSNVQIHRIVVPAEALDKAEGYTLCYRKIIDRQPYFPKTEDEVQIFYPFRPLKKTEDIHIYQLADTHGMIETSAAAAGFFGDDLDLLILNGDIADHSGSVENISIAYRIASLVTGGTLPCIFSRGNHDLRGACAENLAEYTPNQNGNSFYTFRVGCIWGILLDCGEDKNDDHPEYGGTVCCHAFRQRETRYLEKVIANSKDEYAADGVVYRLSLSHVPFAHNNTALDRNLQTPVFLIEPDILTRWLELLKEFVHPDLMLSGHLHLCAVSPIGGKYDQKGQPCPVIIGSLPNHKENTFVGTALTLNKGKPG
jgi:hypothetical protein